MSKALERPRVDVQKLFATFREKIEKAIGISDVVLNQQGKQDDSRQTFQIYQPFDVYKNFGREQLAYFELCHSYPCETLVLSCNASVNEKYRGKGVGSIVHTFRLKLAKELGFSLIQATVNERNAAQIAIMTKFGWNKVTTYVNRDGGHFYDEEKKEWLDDASVVGLWVKDLSTVPE